MLPGSMTITHIKWNMKGAPESCVLHLLCWVLSPLAASSRLVSLVGLPSLALTLPQ